MINTLKGLKEINGKGILQERPKNEDGTVDWVKFDEIRKLKPIFIDHDTDMISFKMLTKPASEGGNLNLCQLTDLITAGKLMLEYLHAAYPCKENRETLSHLNKALKCQEKRTEDRKRRGVEGQNKY